MYLFYYYCLILLLILFLIYCDNIIYYWFHYYYFCNKKKVVSLTETSSEWKQQCYFLTTLPEMVPPETNCNVSIYKFVFTKINLIFKLHFWCSKGISGRNLVNALLFFITLMYVFCREKQVLCVFSNVVSFWISSKPELSFLLCLEHLFLAETMHIKTCKK